MKTDIRFTLFMNRHAFKLRMYKKGYMVFLLTLWDTVEFPLIWWSKNHTRKEYGRAVKVR